MAPGRRDDKDTVIVEYNHIKIMNLTTLALPISTLCFYTQGPDYWCQNSADLLCGAGQAKTRQQKSATLAKFCAGLLLGEECGSGQITSFWMEKIKQ